MGDMLRKVVGFLIAVVLITIILIPQFNINKEIGSTSVIEGSMLSSKITGTTVDGLVVLQYLQREDNEEFDVVVKDEDNDTISNPSSWIKEEASFKMSKEYEASGQLDTITFRMIDKSRTID